MSDPITSPAEDGAGRETLLNQALDAAYHEARSLAEQAGISWKDVKRIADVYYGPAIKNDVEQIIAAESRAAAAEAEVARLREDAERSFQHRNDLSDSIVSLRTEKGALRERVKVLEEALTKIQRNADYGRETYKQDDSETGQSLASCWGIIADFARAALTGGFPDDQA